MQAPSSTRSQHAHTLEERQANEEAQRRALWRMSLEERESAMWSGRLSHVQLLEWSRKRPHEVPKLGREFAWILKTTPEWADAPEREPAEPRQRSRVTPRPAS